MSKHTPGPWIADDNEGSSVWKIYSRMSPSGHGIAGPCVAEVIGDSAEADANSNLIAAAPELLEAAKDVITRWDSPLWKMEEYTAEFINRLREAVAKCEVIP